MTDTELKCRNAKEAAKKLSTASANDKNKALLLIAEELKSNKDYILRENDKDMKAAEENGLPKVLLDRLLLSPDRIDGMAKGVIEVADLPDPVGKTLSDITRPNGLRVKKVSVPLGVIAVIFEARPNVTSDAASLCLKSGNCSVLRGGREAIHSNTAIFNVMRAALKKSPLPEGCIQFITDISHESANELMTMNKYVDVLIPRGSARLIGTVVKNSTVPVIETGVGNCHIYVDKDADLDMAADIIFNAKTSRPSVCNAAESLLIHKDVAEKALKLIKKRLDEKNVELRGDKTSKEILPDIKEASEDDIQATLDFINWCVTSEQGTKAMADDMGFVIPFKTAQESPNLFVKQDAEMTAAGKTPVSWNFTTMPSEEWKNGVGSALTAYAAGTGDWNGVVSAFVDGWASEAALNAA